MTRLTDERIGELLPKSLMFETELESLAREVQQLRANGAADLLRRVEELTRDLGDARELLRMLEIDIPHTVEFYRKSLKQNLPQPATGELVPWDAETRPSGPLVLRKSGQSVCEFSPGWCPSGEKSENSIIPWNDLLDNYEWSRDGKTWQKCGVRK